MESLKHRRFGVEIELSRKLLCVNDLDRAFSNAWVDIKHSLANLGDAGLISKKWRLKIDTSCGGEVVSPILFGPSGLKEIAEVCNMIRGVSERYSVNPVDGECGLHIHIDAGGISPEQLSRLFSLVHMAEPIIYSMYPARSEDYCAPLDVNMRQASRLRDWVDVRDVWYRGSNNVKQKDKVYAEKFINSTSAGDHYDGTRYHGFNIHCYWRLGTVEFRYGAGTVDALHIKAYYEMCLAMVNTSISDAKVNIPDGILSKKYSELKQHYLSNNRFRKYLRTLSSTCGFSRDTVKLITTLVRSNNHRLLNKASISTDGEFLVIDETNIAKYKMRVRNWKDYDTKPFYVNYRGQKLYTNSLPSDTFDIEILESQKNNWSCVPHPVFGDDNLNVILCYGILWRKDSITSRIGNHPNPPYSLKSDSDEKSIGWLHRALNSQPNEALSVPDFLTTTVDVDAETNIEAGDV